MTPYSNLRVLNNRHVNKTMSLRKRALNNVNSNAVMTNQCLHNFRVILRLDSENTSYCDPITSVSITTSKLFTVTILKINRKP